MLLTIFFYLLIKIDFGLYFIKHGRSIGDIQLLEQ